MALLLDLLIALSALFSVETFAGTTQYYYDDLGRIVQAIGSDGSILQYQYDQNGNILAINRIAGSPLIVSGLSPSIGHVTASVTIFGNGFSATANQNDVRFGSIPATVTSASQTQLTVTVPEGAVTGPISVTVGSNTAASPANYVVRKPIINSVLPPFVDAGTPVTLLGQNLNLIPGGSTFSVGGVPVIATSVLNSKATITAPAQSGQVTVSTAYGDATSAASLSVAPIFLGGIANVTSFAPIAAGTPQSIHIDQAYEYAVLSFQAAQGQLYSLRLTDQATVPSNLSTSVSVYAPDHSPFASSGVFGGSGYLDLPQIVNSGTYLVVIASSEASDVQMNVELVLSPTLTPNGTTIQVATTMPGQTGRYSYYSDGSQSVGLGLTALTTAAWAVMPTMLDANGAPVVAYTVCFNGGSGCNIGARALPEGHYAIVVQPGEATTMSFDLTFSQSVAGALQSGIPLDVNIDVPGRNALLSFTATAGQSATIALTDIDAANPNFPPVLAIYDSNGVEIQDLYSSSGTTRNLENLAAGAYKVYVVPQYAATETFKVTLIAQSPQPLTADGSTSNYSTSLPRQSRYFSFAATAGQNLTLALTDLTLTPFPWDNTVRLFVVRPDGAPLAEELCTTYGGCMVAMRNLPQTGTYRVKVVMLWEQVTMSFSLTLAPMLSAPLPVDTPTSVVLDVPGENILYSFTLGSVQNLAINVRSLVTVPADRGVQLFLYDSNGEQVSANGFGSMDATWNLVDLPAGSYTLHLQPGNAATAMLEIARGVSTTSALTVGSSSGTIATTVPGQFRYFTFSATAGQDLGVALTNLTTTGATGVPYVALGIVTPSGIGVPIGNPYCYPSLLPGCGYTPIDLPETGIYRVIVESGQWLSSYSLTLSQSVTGVAALNTPINVTLSTAGQNAVYTFTANDNDNFTLTVNSIVTQPGANGVNVSVLAPPGFGSVGGNSGTGSFTIPMTTTYGGTQTIVVTPLDAATATLQMTLTKH